MEKNKITIVIITLNEEKIIPRCLDHVTWADDIVIIDSYSSDRTVDISKKYTSHIYKQNWLGYGKQKNYALQFVKTEWVLFLDADEIVPPRLSREIQNVIKGNDSYSAYDIPRRNYFLYKPLKFSDQYNWITRLFKINCGKWDERDVHERPIIYGSIGHLNTPIEHINDENNSMSLYLSRLNTYTDLEVKERLKAQRSSANFNWANRTFRMRLKHISRFLPFKPLLHFFWIYIIRLGFLDGYHGFLWAIFHGFVYEMVATAKLFEHRYKKKIDQELPFNLG